MTISTMVFLTTLCVLVLSVIAYAIILGIGPVPTNRRVRQRLKELLPSDVKRVAELGCGWGTLLHLLAKRYPSVEVEAYERSPVPWCLAWFWSRLCRLKNIRVKRSNFFRIALHDVELVVCYLYPKAMQKLAEKLGKELAAGSWVVSHTFALPGWTPVRLVHADDAYQTPIYLYRVTKPMEGSSTSRG